MSWFENVIDAIPVVGVTYRTGTAITAHVRGDHEEAQKQWTDAGINLAGDVIGFATGGVGKVATTAAKIGAKTAVKAVVKQGVKEGVKIAGRAAVRAVSKQLTKSAMKAYAKKYIKKKVKKAAKDAIKQAMTEYFDGEDKGELMERLNEGIGASFGELSELDEQELMDLAYSAVFYAEDDY